MYKIVLYYDFFHLIMYYELYIIKYGFMTWFETAKWHYIVQTEMRGTI